MKIGIIEPKSFSAEAIELLQQKAEVILWNGQDLEQFIADKTSLFVRLSIQWNAQILESASQLKYICSPTTGLNHIDQNYCTSHNIQILSLQGETDFLQTIRATPEHTLGLIIALMRNYHSAFIQSENDWDRDRFKGNEIYGSSIGIIGLGRVGSILANYLTCMGAKVSYYDPNVTDTNYIAFPDSLSLINHNQMIVLCSSYDQTIGTILNQEHLEALKNKYFVNTARAELYDESLLIQLASKKHFKGLAIDVIQNEQSENNHLVQLLALTKTSNTIITPHIGGATHQSMPKTELFIAKKFIQTI